MTHDPYYYDPYYPDYGYEESYCQWEYECDDDYDDDYDADYDYDCDDDAYWDAQDREAAELESYGDVFQRHYIPAKYCQGWI